MTGQQRLLHADDPLPVEIVNPHGTSELVLIGNHAGNLVPSALGKLGVGADDLARHVGWDIGVDALGRSLAARHDAVFVRQRYSRQIIDCNRDPSSADAVPAESDGTAVPGNVSLDPAARGIRGAESHEPYQLAVGSALAAGPVRVSSSRCTASRRFSPAARGPCISVCCTTVTMMHSRGVCSIG